MSKNTTFSILSGENPFYNAKLDEGFLDMFKKIFESFSKFIRGLKSKFGLKTSIKISVPINIEEVRSENTGSSRKDAGSQVEAFSVLFIGREMRSLGFQVVFGLNGKFSDDDSLIVDQIQHLDNKIKNGVEDAIEKNAGNEKKLQSLQRKLSNLDAERSRREEYGLATAARIKSDVIKSDIYPLIHKMTIAAEGESGTGKTKSDINIEIVSVSEKGFEKVLKSLAISHKYNQSVALGTQTTALGFPTSLLGHKGGSKEGKVATINAFANVMKINRQQSEDFLKLYTMFIGNKQARIDRKKEYEEVSKKYFTVLSTIIEQNHQNIYKLIGIEKDVDHFFVNKAKGKNNNFETFHSSESKLYQELYEKFYGSEVAEKLSIVAISETKAAKLSFRWSGKEFFSTKVRPIESNTNSVVTIDGVGIEDLLDAMKKIKL